MSAKPTPKDHTEAKPTPPVQRWRAFWSMLFLYLAWLTALAYIAWVNISAGNQ